MSNFDNIQSKLKLFVRKYYTNELLKGLILFSSIGLLYFIFTVLLEFYLWLSPVGRTILFISFLFIEVLLLIKFIVIPITKLLGLKKGISNSQAAVLIGKYFNEIDDKLLNIIQLSNSYKHSDLLLASIEQKSNSIDSFPFRKAISFASNRKYIKYLSIPVAILMGIYLSGNFNLFTNSYDRVVHPKVVYHQPAPFNFSLLNSDLNVVEGKAITIQITTQGKLIPEDVTIHFLNQHSLMNDSFDGTFEYTFTDINESIQFYVSSSEIVSDTYKIEVIKTPNILDFEMILDFPSYTKRKDVVERNTGNAKIPIGTNIIWNLRGKNVDSILFITNAKSLDFSRDKNLFTFKKRLFKNVDYRVTSSNEDLQNFESLDYSIEVIPDASPEIIVKSDIDSITAGNANFIGQVSDDYGLSKLQLVYYDTDNKEELKTLDIPIHLSNIEEFQYQFPNGIDLVEGIDYEMYFEVFDNDDVYGSKSSKSRIFSYYNKTDSELTNLLLHQQKEAIDDIEQSIENQKNNHKEVDALQESLQNKSDMNWNDQNKLKEFMERQDQYDKMRQEQTKLLQENLEAQPKSSNPLLEERKADIDKLLEESLELEKKKDLQKVLEQLLEKLDREELSKKLNELSEKNRSKEKSLERMLELTKRFYVEEKANQLTEKLSELSKQQDELSESVKNNSLEQEKLNSQFDSLRKELKSLDKENSGLEQPMKFPNTQKLEELTKKDMEEATDELQKDMNLHPENESSESSNRGKNKAIQNQKSAAIKQKELSDKLKTSLNAMQGESLDEDIDMLRGILENLLEFSFQQEELMDELSSIDNFHPEFSVKLKFQHVLKEYFEHVDDSLYTLALRQPKLSVEVFQELSKTHYHINEAILHLADNKLSNGVSDQQYVMTSSNNMSNLLSNLLSGLQNASMSMGQGNGKSFSLADIIKEQGNSIEELKKKMNNNRKNNDPSQEGKESGMKNGEGGLSQGELFNLYKSQAELRGMLQNVLNNLNKEGQAKGDKVIDKMKDLERKLLYKNLNVSNLAFMKLVHQELLKLDDSKYKRGIDNKRDSQYSTRTYKANPNIDVNDSNLKLEEKELLQRQSLPLHPDYSIKVKNYFKFNDSLQ